MDYENPPPRFRNLKSHPTSKCKINIHNRKIGQYCVTENKITSYSDILPQPISVANNNSIANY